MNRYFHGRKDGIPALATVLIIALMCGAAEYFGDREIIFPEIAALAVGYLCAPKRSWRVSSARMLLLIIGGAAAGLAMSCLMPGPLYLKLMAAYLLAQLIFLYSGTTLAPMISAVVLPVLLGSRSIAYLVSAAVMTPLIVIVHELLVCARIRPAEPFYPVPRPDRLALQRVLLRLVVAALLGADALSSGWRYMIAPPLLVAFTELSEHWTPDSKRQPLVVVTLFTGCAAIGSVCRWSIAIQAGLPLWVAASLAAVLMLFIVYTSGMFMPPAGAVTTLAMLIPEQSVPLYPLQIATGSTALMLGVVLIYQQRVKQE